MLLKLSEKDIWTVADAYEGTIVFGGNGAGKTSGSGKDIAKAFLKQGFGGLVLTVKIDEATRWCNYVHECGRAADLITVEPGRPAALNFLEYEAARPGLGAGLTYELVRILQIAMDGGRERGQSENPYWDDAVAQLLTNAIDLVLMATGRVSLPDVVDAIRASLDSSQATNVSDSLLGNLQTKIFHANACPLTNEYAEKLYGSELQATANMSVGTGGVTGGYQRVMLPILPAIKFTTLKKGGAANHGVVDGYVFQAGKIWNGSDGKHNRNWLLVPFKQD